MATIIEMVANRLPDEAALFAASVPTFIEENLGLVQSLAEFKGKSEADLSIAQKSLVADMAAKDLIMPAMSKYKKEMSKVEGDQAGKAEFNDKLKFLAKMESRLEGSIETKRRLLNIVDNGVAMVVVE
jgi:hypothetical protein